MTKLNSTNKFLILTGKIHDVTFKEDYDGLQKIIPVDIDNFDINNSRAVNLVNVDNNEMAISQWVSPKRTRSEPLARVYKTLSKNKRITIIPVQKDEGKDGDNDWINASTLAWMNLMNVYIILGYYVDAERHRRLDKNKITNQKLDNDYIIEKIREISAYQSDAHHWNNKEFSKEYEKIVNISKAKYVSIGERLNVLMHPKQSESITGFNFKKFLEESNRRSEEAAKRESKTLHKLEVLDSSTIKPIFKIKNFYDGEYSLTVDEAWVENGRLILQESKNTTKDNIPSTGEMCDAFFKTILFCNMDELNGEDDNNIDFEVRVKLTSSAIKKRYEFPLNNKDVNKCSAETGIDIRKLEFINCIAKSRNKYTSTDFKVVLENNGN